MQGFALKGEKMDKIEFINENNQLTLHFYEGITRITYHKKGERPESSVGVVLNEKTIDVVNEAQTNIIVTTFKYQTICCEH